MVTRVFFYLKSMEQRQFSENEMLSTNSESKFRIQNQLLEYIIGILEDHLEGHHSQLQAMTVHENPYALFVIAGLSDRYAVWFKSLCVEDRTDEKRRPPLTEKAFLDRYDGKPEKVLEEVIAHLGYATVEQYLRELEDWFKVSSTPDESRNIPRHSMLAIPLASRMTHDEVTALFQKTRMKSA